MIYFGYTTMSHGLKGELKLYTNFSLKEKVLKTGFPVYIENQKHIITTVRHHKDYELVTFDKITDINAVEHLRHKEIYVLKEDLKEDLILEELIGYEVREKEESLGKIKNILYNKSGMLLEVEKNKKFFIPYQENFIKSINETNHIVYVNNVKGVLDSL